MSQTTFAVEVLKVAVSTVARWETSDPPSGDTLLKLSDVAAERGGSLSKLDVEPFSTLEGVFRGLYADEFLRNIQRHKAITCDYYLIVPETATGSPALYRFSKIGDPAKINAVAEDLKYSESKNLAGLGRYILSLQLVKNK